MKKFLRNLLSGYFLVLLILLIEIAVFIFVQFFMEDVILAVLGNDAANDTVKLILSLCYLVLRAIIFVVALIIFFKIINKGFN